MVEEFAPNPPPPQSDPQALWMGLILVVVAVLGGVIVYFGFIQQKKPTAAPQPMDPTPIAPAVRAPSVEEVSETSLAPAKELGLSLIVSDVAVSEKDGVIRWAGQVLLRNDGASIVDTEQPDAGNTYLEEETNEGPNLRCRTESRRATRIPLLKDSCAGMQWEDEFRREKTVRFRFVHVEVVDGGKRVVASPWIDLPPKKGR